MWVQEHEPLDDLTLRLNLVEDLCREPVHLRVWRLPGIWWEVCSETSKLLVGIKTLEAAEAAGEPVETLAAMESLREAADALEGLVPDSIWPLPSYTEMLFVL